VGEISFAIPGFKMGSAWNKRMSDFRSGRNELAKIWKVAWFIQHGKKYELDG